MPLVLCRVDDRLVHGQVVIGWGRPLDAKRVILVNDEVAGSAWEQDLYRTAAPDGLKIAFSDTANGIRDLPEWAALEEKTILLTGDLETMSRLREAHPELITQINLGGIHHRAGRAERLRYLFLDETEVELIKHMVEDGAILSAQDLPTARAVGSAALL